MGKSYKIKVGDKTYTLKVPSWLTGTKDVERAKMTTYGNEASREVKNLQERDQLRQLDEDMKNVGKSRAEQEIFNNDYTD